MSTAPKAAIIWSLDRSADVGRGLLAATRRLRETGSDTPQLDAAVLLGHVLGVNKAWLYAFSSRLLTEEEISRFEDLVRRRMRHEPVAYLVGYKSFMGVDITVDRRVLIPRPETELLAERAVDYIAFRIQNGETPRVADIGTGSGAIAVTLAMQAPDITVYATDIADGALAVAGQNVWRYGVGEQVQLLPGFLLDPLPEPVDVIVANLPYIATADLPHLPPQVRDYEPTIALDGGPDGLTLFRAFFDQLAQPERRKRLRPRARIFLEIGATQGGAVSDLAKEALPDAAVAVWPDYADLDRLVVIDA
jgi:release factor glutamine methyltransferase